MRTPRWWYRRTGRPAWAVLLKPLAGVWAAATARRIANTQPFDPGVPVICVGNLTVGGTGKTPIVRELARRLGAHVLTRGHGGSLTGPVRVDPAAHTAAQVGDEPLMLAGDLTVWVARDRAEGARAAAAAGARVIVMDDGHQNPSVKKTLSLIVVDGETRDGEWPFGDGSVVPTGPMREPLATGLGRADAAIVLLPAGLEQADPALLALFGSTPVLIARLEPDGPPPAGPLLAFAGIGKPWKFERALKEAGGQVESFQVFADHQALSAQDVEAIRRQAREKGWTPVTTEKDWYRLSPEDRQGVACWPVRARFEDEAALARVLAGIKS